MATHISLMALSNSLSLLHYYPDDSELYVFLLSSNISTGLDFMDCLSHVKCWMSDNPFQLADSKSGMTSDLYFGQKNLGNLLHLEFCSPSECNL